MIAARWAYAATLPPSNMTLDKKLNGVRVSVISKESKHPHTPEAIRQVCRGAKGLPRTGGEGIRCEFLRYLSVSG